MFGKENPKEVFKDVKVLSSEECITQYKSLVCDFKLTKVKNTRRKFAPRRKIWKLHEDSIKSDFRSYINQYRVSDQKDNSVEGYWDVLKVALLETTDRRY